MQVEICSNQYLCSHVHGGNMIAYTDGGSRGPGMHGAVGGVLYLPRGDAVAIISQYLGVNIDSNEAEYHAVIALLQRCLEMNAMIFPHVREIHIHTDSRILVNHRKSRLNMRSEKLKLLFGRIGELESRLKKNLQGGFSIEYHYVRRERNRIADHLVNEAFRDRFQKTRLGKPKKRTDREVSEGEPRALA